jgi:hypothetical protein
MRATRWSWSGATTPPALGDNAICFLPRPLQSKQQKLERIIVIETFWKRFKNSLEKGFG